MPLEIVPNSFWSFPSFRFPTVWDEELSLSDKDTGGLSVSEDDKTISVEAHLPGVDPKDIEVTFDKGVLWVKGEAKEEEKGKKYYRKSAKSFSYRVAVPGNIDPKNEPKAVGKNGVMKVTFQKVEAAEPKKIAVKSEE